MKGLLLHGIYRAYLYKARSPIRVTIDVGIVPVVAPRDQKRTTHYHPQANGVVESLRDATEGWEALAVE